MSINDKLDGAAGTDKLTAYVSGTALASGVGINNIENVEILTTGAGFTVDASVADNFAGLQTLSIQAGAGAISATTKANATSVSTIGGTTVGVTDSGTTDALTSVSVTKNAGAATITSDALTSLTIVDTAQNATVTAAAGTRVMNLTVNKLATGGTIIDAEATTLNVTATGADSVVTALSAAKATTVTFAGDKKLTSAGETFTAATSITSTNSGGVSLGTAIGAAVSFTGGSGADKVTISNSMTKAVSMGDGNDTVVIANAATTIGTGGSIAAGAGTDTLEFATHANAVTVSASNAYVAKVTGFEAIKLAANTTLNAAVNIANLNADGANNITTLTVAANTDSTAYNGLKEASTVEFVAGITNGKTTTIALLDATGSANVLNIKTNGASGAASDVKTLSIADVETINIESNDTATTATGDFANVAALTAGAAKTVKVFGDGGFNLAYTGTTATAIDASGITKGGFTWTAGALAAAATASGSATGTNTITLTAATKAVTYTGGTGADDVIIAETNTQANVINLGNGTNTLTGVDGDAGGTITTAESAFGANTITGGTGADTIKVGNGNNTVSLGDGANGFTAGSGNNTYTGGKDVDTIVVAGGANNISVGAGADSVTVGGGANTINLGVDTDVDAVVITAIPANASTYSTITNYAVGDTIDLSALTTVARANGALGEKLVLADTATLSDYVTAGAAATIADAGASLVKWFQFSGNTYLVVDNTLAANAPDDGAGFEAGLDSIVRLSGVLDLTRSTTTADVLTFIA